MNDPATTSSDADEPAQVMDGKTVAATVRQCTVAGVAEFIVRTGYTPDWPPSSSGHLTERDRYRLL